MKKSRKIFLLLLAIMLVVTMFPTANVQAASKVKLNKKETTIYVGKSETLKVTGTSKKVTWTSSDKKKATVSSKGKVTAKKAGSVTITAKVGNKKYNCKVTVKNPSLNAKSKTVHVGKTYTLKLNGATVSRWSSSNKNKASVSSAGKVTAKKAGTVTITAADKAGKKYTCKVTVEGHKAGNWQVTVQPTENSTGTKVKNCTVCGTRLESASIDKIAHSHSYSWETNGSSRTMKCSCGATGITEECVAGVWGYFDRSAAEELFYYVNQNRAVTTYTVQDDDGHTIGIETVPALTNFDGLYATAKQRAAEIATNFNHDGVKTANENIARGCENANACQQAWCYSSGHANTMTNNIYTQGSCAVFYYDADGSGTNLYPFYVLVVN